jgi:cell division protein FtsI (penicillin-binding protein 3)
MTDLVDRRIGLLFAGFLALLALAAAQALHLAILRGSKLSSDAVAQQIAIATIPAHRGTIVDRHGVVLATSEPASDVSADPLLIKDPDAIAPKLSIALGVPVGTLVTKLARRDTGFVYLARRVPAGEAARIKALNLTGIELTATQRRVYPRSWTASQVLGEVGTDGNGLSGLEYSANHLLAGHDGLQRSVNDALGQQIAVSDPRPALAGQRIELNLDSVIQDKAEQVLQQVGATYRPLDATAIVMDPRTGGLLAIANWPQTNANDPGGAPASALEDRATGFDYEPGSTFKPFTVAGALTEGVVTPNTPFDLAPSIQVADRTIHDAEDRGPETLTTAQILQQSSNVGAITIAERLGDSQAQSDARLSKWIARFGFGKPTGVDLPGEEQGIVPPLAKWSGSSIGNIPIGQGVSVTPLQIATAYSAIANGGILRPPRIIRRIGDRLVPQARGHRVISAHVAHEIRKMLEGVLAPGGTASEVSIPGYQLAGKTGTANKVDPATGQYSTTNYVASFVGFAPASHPKLLISVMVDQPQGGSIFGGTVAAPAFQKIAQYALPYLRIPSS